MIVLISIGNSDDKLSQRAWSDFYRDVNNVLTDWPIVNSVHGVWISDPTSQYQNACWQVDIFDLSVDRLQNILRGIAKSYNQDSIAWTECKETEFLG
jgi:DNA-binding cell septation regulator SpoVG